MPLNEDVVSIGGLFVLIKDRNNFCSGALFIVVGVGAVALSLEYKLGTPARMGSGFFPLCLGIILTGLGIILTFSPVTVCSIYTNPADRLGLLNTIRSDWGLSVEKDQQIGGLLMWVPACMVYLGAILATFSNWYQVPQRVVVQEASR